MTGLPRSVLLDETVQKAMLKWPDVPDLYGWLKLDCRGHWWLPTGEISHPGLIAFIGRNYQADSRGCWYFQNGPQRVWVELECTPWVYRPCFDDEDRLQFTTQTGLPVAALSAVAQFAGRLLLTTEHGIGIVDDRYLAVVEPCLQERETGRLVLSTAGREFSIRVDTREWSGVLGFVRLPQLITVASGEPGHCNGVGEVE